MIISLMHRHYDESHLVKVTEQMKTMGAPKLRCVWSEVHGMWMAVEGCHRLRAAKALGLEPQIIDISEKKSAAVQWDGESKRFTKKQLLELLNNNSALTTILDF